jgi:hypothetical protein
MVKALPIDRRRAALTLGALTAYDLGALHGDDDLAASVAVHHLPDGLGHLGQREGPANDRGELAGLDQLPQGLQVLLAGLGAQHPLDPNPRR